MSKFLINCCFNYYNDGSIDTMPNYALIIDVSITSTTNDDLEPLILNKLKELNFNLPNKSSSHYEISFTAQQIF